MTASSRPYFVRPVLERSGPIRSAGTFYRVADDDPEAIGGMPLTSVETAATAAVRLGYKIASAQLDRSARIAKRLRDEGDRAAGIDRESGDSSEKQALDATEQLIFKALLAGLGWLEGFAAAPGHPMKRLAAAQFKLLGSMLGVMPAGDATGRGTSTSGDADGINSAIDALRDVLQQIVDSTGTSVTELLNTDRGARPPQERAKSAPAEPRQATLRVKHMMPKGRPGTARAVRVVSWEVEPKTTGTFPLVFYGEKARTPPLRGTFTSSDKEPPMLTLQATRGATPRGFYRAAICDSKGLQLGYIEVAV